MRLIMSILFLAVVLTCVNCQTYGRGQKMSKFRQMIIDRIRAGKTVLADSNNNQFKRQSFGQSTQAYPVKSARPTASSAQIGSHSTSTALSSSYPKYQSPNRSSSSSSGSSGVIKSITDLRGKSLKQSTEIKTLTEALQILTREMKNIVENQNFFNFEFNKINKKIEECYQKQKSNDGNMSDFYRILKQIMSVSPGFILDKEDESGSYFTMVEQNG